MGTWLVGLAGPIITRMLLAIGVGTVTYAGLSAAIGAAISAAKTAYGGMTGDVASIVALSGFGDALGIIAGAIVTSVSLVALKKFAAKV